MKSMSLPKVIVFGLFISFAIPANAVASTTPKAGTACPKIGMNKEFQNKKFTCIKNKKKLVWNRGIEIEKTMSEETTPNPIITPVSITPTEVTQKYRATGCHARVSSTLQLKQGSMWIDLGVEDGWEPIASCPSTNPYEPFKTVTLQTGSVVRWRIFSPGYWEWFGSEEIVSPIFEPTSVCQLLGQDGNTSMNVGFPKRSSRLTSNGLIKAIVIGVDFPDVPGLGTPATVFKSMTDGMQYFYKKMSGNRVSFNFTFTDKYIRMPFESTKFNLGKWNGGDSWGYINALIASADETVGFDNYDVVYFLSPRNIPRESIAYGPAFPIDLQSKDGPIKNSTFSGADAYQAIPGVDWKWISHETGHLFGMHDLYTLSPKQATYGSWDLMAQNFSRAAIELNAWNRFIQGWLTNDQIKCLDKNNLTSTEVLLSPIERVETGIKAITIKLSDTKILVLESRRNEGLDTLPPGQAGTLVYTVDMSIASAQGGWNTQRRPGSLAPDFTDAALKAGDKIMVDGVTIEVLLQDFKGDKIRIS